MSESRGHTPSMPNQQLTPQEDPEVLRKMPHVPNWSEYEYRIYELGRDRYEGIMQLIGKERFNQLVSHVYSYASGSAYEGEDFQRTAVGHALMVFSASRGKRPDHESNVESYRHLRLPSIANTALQLHAHATNLAEAVNSSVQELPEHFGPLMYGTVYRDVTELTRAVVQGELEAESDYLSAEDYILLSTSQATFTMRALLRTAVMSGDKSIVGEAVDSVKAMLTGYTPHSTNAPLLRSAMQSRDRDFRPMVATVRVIGDDLPHAFRDFIYCESLARTQRALAHVLGMKRRHFEQIRDETRQALAFACQPDVYHAIAAAVEYGTSLAAAAAFAEHFSAEPSAPSETSPNEAVVDSVVAPEVASGATQSGEASLEQTVSPDKVRERLEAMVTQWTELEILGETHEKTGIKRAAEKLQSDITHLREQGRSVPDIDLGRLEMIAALKDIWPGSQVVSGVFAGRRKGQAQRHDDIGDDAVDMLKSYIALVLPIIEDGQCIGEYVVAENLIAGRHGTYVYLSLAGGNRPWTEVFGSKKKGVNKLPGVRVLAHTKVGSRTAAQTTYEKLIELLTLPYDQFMCVNFSGERGNGRLDMRLGKTVLTGDVHLDKPDTVEHGAVE